MTTPARQRVDARRVFLPSIVAAIVIASPQAFAEAPTEAPAGWAVDGAALRRGDDVVTLPCMGTTIAAEGKELFVACDSGGVVVLDGSVDPPKALRIARLTEPAPAKRVYEVDGAAWVETPNGARRLRELLPVEPVSQPPVAVPATPIKVEEPVHEPTEDAPKAEAAPVGRVVDQGVGFVVIDLGETHGLAPDDHVEFFTVESVDLGAGEVVEQEIRLSVGEVETASTNRAKVRLGLNEAVPTGAQARKNAELKPRGSLFPERPSGVWEVGLNVRPFLALGTLGGGAILDGNVGYRFEAPVAVDLMISPFGFGIASDGNILTFAGNVVASYDTTPFQIGLGAGVGRIATTTGSAGDYLRGVDSDPPTFRAGFSAAQYVRLGSVDGLHAEVVNNFILFEKEFIFGGITIEGAVPLRIFRQNGWILARGGGGVPGHIFAELGIRVLAVGNGGPGSIFVTPTVGGGVLQGEAWRECEYPGYFEDPRDGAPIDPTQNVQGWCRESYSYGGPLIGFGIEWRI